jgi:hypothetical protein
MKAGNIWEEFEWPVASEYRWRDTPQGLALAIAPGASIARTYRPLARAASGLFREFADLRIAPNSILEFVHLHGNIGPPVQHLAGTRLRFDPATLAPAGIAAAGFAAFGGPENLVEP